MNETFLASDRPAVMVLFGVCQLIMMAGLILTAHDLAGAVRLAWLDNNPMFKRIFGVVNAKRGVIFYRIVLSGTFYLCVPVLFFTAMYTFTTPKTLDYLEVWRGIGFCLIAIMMILFRPVHAIHGYIQFLESCVYENHPHELARLNDESRDSARLTKEEIKVAPGKVCNYVKVLRASPTATAIAAASVIRETGS